MAENRLDRELTSREKTTRKAVWLPPELLPTPKAQEGYTYHWVRVSTQGQADPTNISSKLREGWEPCKAVDHPEITLVSVENDRFKDNVVMGGLMLCKAPVEMIAGRTAHYQQSNDNAMQSVDNNFMKTNDPRMPLFNERKTRVTFGNGKN